MFAKQRADRDELVRELLAVILDPENGIAVPERSRLAARLERFRAQEEATLATRAD